MAVYCDFNEINGGKVVPYYLQGMLTNSYFHSYKYGNHAYWQTRVIFRPL